MTYICLNKLTSTGSDNGLSPGRRQATIWTNDGKILTRPLGTNFSEILNEIHFFIQESAFESVICKIAPILSRPQCLNSLAAPFINKRSVKLTPGAWFNIKMTSYQYRKSHCGDKTILRPSYLHNGISYTGKTTSLYWIRAQDQEVDKRIYQRKTVACNHSFMPTGYGPISRLYATYDDFISHHTTLGDSRKM